MDNKILEYTKESYMTTLSYLHQRISAMEKYIKQLEEENKQLKQWKEQN